MTNYRILRATGILCGLLAGCYAVVGGEDDPDDPGFRESQTNRKLIKGAICKAVVKGKGTFHVEREYLPRVVACENGDGPPEALKAQAIAARTYLYYHMRESGWIGNGTSWQVFSCGRSPKAIHRQVVAETAQQVLALGTNLICGFYIAGTLKKGSCDVISSGNSTNNQGAVGDAVRHTPMGLKNPAYCENRGCMSQHSANCLAIERGYDHRQILSYFYGADMRLYTAPGDCGMGQPIPGGLPGPGPANPEPDPPEPAQPPEPSEPPPPPATCNLGTEGDHEDPCPGIPEETWRCVHSEAWNTKISQVCRGGIWQTVALNPKDCGACCGAFSSACLP